VMVVPELRANDGGAWAISVQAPSPPHNSPSSNNHRLSLNHTRSTATMAMKVPLLDEQDFNFPLALSELEGQDINLANNFCWYFHNSQFFETSCNNSAILGHHRDDPATNAILHDRKTFDERLRSIPEGLQFVVSGEPQGEGQPWLYQRQNKVRNVEGQVETYVEGNWYNRGTQVLMAPSLLDVVRARLVSCRLLTCETRALLAMNGSDAAALTAHVHNSSPCLRVSSRWPNCRRT
jgi:hypothetical protein